MAKFYTENNRGGAMNLFRKRTMYKYYSSAMAKGYYRDHPHLIDFNFGEKYLYGRVNRLFVPMVVDATPLVDKIIGDTSVNAGHLHKYQVDANGNGWAIEVVSPDDSRIRHRHQIINGVVQAAQSKCYPNCENLYGTKGVSSHIHDVLKKGSKTTTSPRIKKFNPTLAKEEGASALNFVVDAFHDLAQQFQKAAFLGKIDTQDEFLSTLKVYKSYQNPKKLYDPYRLTYFDIITKLFRKNKIRVRNYEEFLKHLMSILSKTAKKNPLTKTAFIKSRRCPVNCSGLVVEIANADFSNDFEKIASFYNSNNWEFYAQACADYGFMIDGGAPWRLIADIGSAPIRSTMVDYAEKYNYNSTDEIIDNSYKLVHIEYYNNFKNNLLSLYNAIKLNRFYVTEQCGAKTIRKKVVPASYSRSVFFAKYSEQHFLKTYFEIRFIEEESQFTDSKKELMIDDCIELYKANGLTNCLNSFERILNKPFDYNGSLGYISRQLDIISNEELQSETTQEAGTQSGTSQVGERSSGY
jgi:hypothetical protein